MAKGARVIEKHFTLNKKMKGPDHWFSVDTREFREYVKNIRLTEKMLGNKTILPSSVELKNRNSMQVSMIFGQNVKRNNKIKYKYFFLKSNKKSLTYSQIKETLLEKKLKFNKKIGDVINLKDVK